MKTTLHLALAVLILPILAVPASAQPNLDGTWDLQASGVIPPVVEEVPALNANPDRGVMIEPCVFEGSGNLVQDGNQLTGQANLMLISGPAECPDEMMADIMGEVEGSSFFGMLDGGQMFGGLNFNGTISQDGTSIEGTYDVKPEGPFSNVTNGVWTAALQLSILAIPTVGAWGLGLFAAILALTSLLFLRRLWA